MPPPDNTWLLRQTQPAHAFPRTAAGFTLLEIMVATTILGIVLMSIYGVLARTLAAKNRAEERAEIYATGREAVLRVAGELESALSPCPPPRALFRGIPGTGQGWTDAVTFEAVVPRLAGLNQNRGGRAVISYWAIPVPDRPQVLALLRQEMYQPGPVAVNDQDPNATPAPAQSVPEYVLEEMAGISFKYFDVTTGQWVNAWDTEPEAQQAAADPQQPPPRLPGAIEVTVYLADSDGAVHPFSTIVDLPLEICPPPTPLQ